MAEQFLKLSVEARRADAESCIAKRGDDHHPILAIAHRGTPAASKFKYAMQGDTPFGHLTAAIRAKIPNLDASTALFLFIAQPDGGSILAPPTKTVREVYSAYLHTDKFLHVTYALENVFGY